MGLAIEHHVWVAALLLESVLPACSMLRQGCLGWLALWMSDRGAPGAAHVSLVICAGTAVGWPHLPAATLETIAVAYGSVCAYLGARFLWRSSKLVAIRREAEPLVLTGEAARCWARCEKRFGMGGAALAASSLIFGPVTLGLGRKLILLPTGMVQSLPETEMETVLAHEFAHMRRNDFLKNLFYELLSLPVSYHPLLWRTRGWVRENREMLCDQIAAEVMKRLAYARSLLRLASLIVAGAPAKVPHAIGSGGGTTVNVTYTLGR